MKLLIRIHFNNEVKGRYDYYGKPRAKIKKGPCRTNEA